MMLTSDPNYCQTGLAWPVKIMQHLFDSCIIFQYCKNIHLGLENK